MGNRFGNRADESFENESAVISAFIALDGSSNVIGYLPTSSPFVATGPYTRAVGLQKAIGQAGSVVTQPHTATGTYLFNLDEPWFAATELWVQQTDQGAVASLSPYVDANVTAATSNIGAWPGNNAAIAAQTVRVLFRTAAAGALANPVANTGFWLGMKLKRTGV